MVQKEELSNIWLSLGFRASDLSVFYVEHGRKHALESSTAVELSSETQHKGNNKLLEETCKSGEGHAKK